MVEMHLAMKHNQTQTLDLYQKNMLLPKCQWQSGNVVFPSGYGNTLKICQPKYPQTIFELSKWGQLTQSLQKVTLPKHRSLSQSF